MSDNSILGSYHETLRNLEITEKSRTTFLILIALVILLVVIVVIMLAVWPSIPSYLKLPICNNKFCLSSSLQVSSLVDREQTVCAAPYEWACGQFVQEFNGHELNGKFRGEWNQRNVFRYDGKS